MRSARCVSILAGALVVSCASDEAHPEQSYHRVAMAALSPTSLFDVADRTTTHGVIPKGRQVIKQGSVVCEATDYQRTSSAMEHTVLAYGGYVLSATARSENSRRRFGTIEARVPAKVFEAALDSIGSLASQVISRTVSGADVSEDYVDLRARLHSKQLAEARYREILRAAKTVKDLLEVERAMAEVREEIEQLEGRRQFLDEHTTMASITIELVEPAPPVMVATTGLRDRIANAIDQGKTEGGKVLGLLITYGMASIPVIVLTAIVAGLALRFRRMLAGRALEPKG